MLVETLQPFGLQSDEAKIISPNSLLKNPIFVILSEAKDRISVGDSSAFGLIDDAIETFSADC